ncbi:hypothetical protein GNF42_14710, partial [Clostridium perfringens]|uniref:triple tyrosine motif-containing protein n=1 Tax=Clostridium perfringens TaxID=1502 RepID=UPI002AC6880D
MKLDSFKVEGEFVTGQPINLSATGNMQSDTMYKFAYRDDSTGEWTVIQDYSSNNKATFTPNKTGSYRFVVHVKHKKSLEAYDDFGFEDKNVAGKGKVTSFNVTGNMITGSTINISANAEPEDVLYKFAIRDSSGEWKVIQDYSEKNSVNYNIPFSGDLRVVVHVKHKLSSKAYDDYDLRDFNVKYSTVALGEFNVDGANIVEHDIVMNAKANPQNEALYK